MFTRLLPVLALTSVPALAQNIVPVAYESFDYTTNLGIGNGNGFAWLAGSPSGGPATPATTPSSRPRHGRRSAPS